MDKQYYEVELLLLEKGFLISQKEKKEERKKKKKNSNTVTELVQKNQLEKNELSVHAF